MHEIPPDRRPRSTPRNPDAPRAGVTHTYLAPRDIDRPVPDLFDRPFHSVHDVIDYACEDGLFDWRTYPEIWCLSDAGYVRSYLKCTSLDRIRRWAKHPRKLLLHRHAPGAVPGSDRWLINEPRFGWLDESQRPDEGDVAAFVALRRRLARDGIELVDCMLWSDDLRCWSMHELTSGRTDYGTSATPHRPT